MDLRELGALLRAERERRGLSIDQVSDKIKITRTCIAAIEEGNEDCLPHPVYAKGFIKNYAKLLEMDTEAFREQLSRIYQAEETPLRDIPLLHDLADAPEGDEARPRSGSFGQTRIKWPHVVVVVVILVAAGWFGYSAFFSRSAKQSPSAALPASEQKTPSAATSAPVPPQTQAPTPTPTPTPTPATPEPSQAQPALTSPNPGPTTPPQAPPAVEPAKPAPETTPEAKTPEPSAEDRATEDIALSGSQTAAPAAPGAKQFTVGDHGPHTVRMTASDRCWLQAGADGGTMRETMLGPGDVFVGRFTDYLLVRLGNAGAVEIQFDGKVYPFHANKGSVKTLKFMGRSAEDNASPTAPDNGKPAASPKSGQMTIPAGSDNSAGPEKPVATDQTTTPAATSTGGKELEVYGQDGSWVILMPDKGPTKEIYIKKGQRLTVPFDEKIDIKLGNPSNVIFRYDGKETPVTTERGESKTLHFP